MFRLFSNSESFLGSGRGNQKGHDASSWATSETNSESEAALIAPTRKRASATRQRRKRHMAAAKRP